MVPSNEISARYLIGGCLLPKSIQPHSALSFLNAGAPLVGAGGRQCAFLHLPADGPYKWHSRASPTALLIRLTPKGCGSYCPTGIRLMAPDSVSSPSER
jgi:hypothetical protein